MSRPACALPDNPGALGEKITVKYRGATFVVDEDRVPALLAQLGLGPVRPRQPGIARGTATDHERTLIVALRAVLAHPDGLPSPNLAAILNLRGAKGLAMTSRVWRRALAAIDLDFDQVFEQSRDSHVRYWHPGPRAKDALRALEKKRPARDGR
jgi:hypothetical protein